MSISNKELKPAIRRLLVAIAEAAVIEEQNDVLLNKEGLRLKALIREQDTGKIAGYLSELEENGYITKWGIVGDLLSIVLARTLSLPDIETSHRELVWDNVLRRAILFRLYEEVRNKGYRVTAQVALSELADNLQVKSAQDIARNASYLKDIGLIESPYMDGGTLISHLTAQGMEIAKTTETLLSEFPTIDIQVQTKEEEVNVTDPKKVFVVHGRNEDARGAMFTFLRSVGLEPIEWSEAIRLTGKATPYIGEVLDIAFSHAQAIVVLLTGDDLARLGNRFTNPGEKDEELTPQARPNVIFEAGLAFGRNPDRTVLVQLGNTRPLSDLAGRHLIMMDNSVKKRQELASRLQTAGCTVQIEHRTDWHIAGDFGRALVTPDNSETSQQLASGDEQPKSKSQGLIIKQVNELRTKLANDLQANDPILERTYRE